MPLHALLRDNVVVDLKEITSEEEYRDLSNQYQLIVDVSDYLAVPQVGWVLAGNKIVPPPGQSLSIQKLIEAKIKFYQEQAPELLRQLYAQNTLMGITTAQSDQMFDEYEDVLIRLREGAWPTALYRLQQKTPSGFVTQEMINAWIALIQSYMI